jgi:membrane associated rhomboid family serine protease
MDDRKKFFQSLVFPLFFLITIWLVKIFEIVFGLNLMYVGLFPLKWSGLRGILTSPLIHADFRHLFDNSVPVFILSLAVFYFYKPVAFKVFFFTWIISGMLVWFGGRPAYHIGASGLIYGFASFLFFSGIFRNSINLLAISLLVVFLYGSLVWGIFPFDYKISWESHLFGALTGFFLALAYRHYGPPPSKESYDENPLMEEEVDDEIDDVDDEDR